MIVLRDLKSELGYARNLVAAGRDGIASARREFDGRLLAPASKTAVLPPAVIGAGIGLLSSSIAGNRRSASRLAIGGLVGTAIGLGAAVAWRSRHFTARAARNAARRIGAVADQRWLEKNPIDYA
jgi:hypothetical protein